MTIIGWFNYFILRWFFVRLGLSIDKSKNIKELKLFLRINPFEGYTSKNSLWTLNKFIILWRFK